MSDTGAPWNLPYPLNTDLVRDGAVAIKDLAEATATGLSAAGNPGIGSNVVQAFKADTFTTSSTSLVNITGLAATITLTSDTSKVLAVLTFGQVDGSTLALISGDVTRDGTPVGIGNADGSRTRSSWARVPNTGNRAEGATWSFLDSPETTSAVTYQARMRVGSGTAYINRSDLDSDNATITRSVCTLTLIEVAP